MITNAYAVVDKNGDLVYKYVKCNGDTLILPLIFSDKKQADLFLDYNKPNQFTISYITIQD